MSHTLLLQNAKLFSPMHGLHDKVVEILVKNGLIEAVGEGLGMAASELIDCEGAYVSAGWLDAFGVCPDPGEPWKESLQSYADAAQQGGFVQVAALCGSAPKPDNESVIAQVLQVGSNLRAEILPIGHATIQGDAKEMSEVHEMHRAGAIAFTDGIRCSASVGLRYKIMQYTQSLSLNYLHFPYQKALAPDGKIHEGMVNASLGMKGIPSIAETVELLADIEIAKYLKTPLRVMGISCSESVSLIRAAKKEGLKIYAAVPVMNLLYTDEALLDFDENFKLLPPLRSENDRKSLLLGLLDGTLDAVVSNHHPEDIESKKVEFDYSAWGANTLAQVFPMMCKAFENETAENWLPLLYRGSRTFLGLPEHDIYVGAEASFTIFSIDGSYSANEDQNKSKAYNLPSPNAILKGCVLGTIRKGCYMKNDD
ncbi:MAG: hypothetical protein EXR17_01630 [Flavobacteriaceae bacterium]|nr:hypothetical protein [Flavobacteriaceae bacterium]